MVQSEVLYYTAHWATRIGTILLLGRIYLGELHELFPVHTLWLYFYLEEININMVSDQNVTHIKRTIALWRVTIWLSTEDSEMDFYQQSQFGFNYIKLCHYFQAELSGLSYRGHLMVFTSNWIIFVDVTKNFSAYLQIYMFDRTSTYLIADSILSHGSYEA